MNERIQQMIYSLNEKAGVHWINEDKIKFALLIVRECIRCCDDVDVIQKHYLKYGIDQELDANQCIEVIKKHFGVGE